MWFPDVGSSAASLSFERHCFFSCLLDGQAIGIDESDYEWLMIDVSH